MPKNTFIKLIEANLEELFELENSDGVQDPLEHAYLQILKVYLRGDHQELKSLCANSNINKISFLKPLIELRYQILVSKVDRENIQTLTGFCKSDNTLNSLAHWRGEIAFVVGMAYLELKEYENAKNIFKVSYQELDLYGAKKKAVKALLNVLVAESRAHNKKKLLIDYEFVANKALAAQDSIVAGICYMNISREVQLIGSLNLALKYINRSITCLMSDQGINHYYSAILQRCHVLLDLGRTLEAQLDYEEALLSPHLHIQEATKILSLMFKKDKPLQNTEIQIEKLDPTWRGRLKDFLSHKKYSNLSDLESNLIESLLTKKRTKNELIDILYGNKIDYPAAENRFRVLLSRLKKRHPGLVVSDKNEFKIADEIFFTSEVS